MDELILNKLNPERSISLTDPRELEQVIAIAKSQQEIIKKKLVSTAFTLNNGKRIKCFIQNYHERLSYLTDFLLENHPVKTHPNEIEYMIMLDAVLTALIDIMEFIFVQFRKYFDLNNITTKAFRQKAIKSFFEKTSIIENRVTNSKLLPIALKPVKEFIQKGTACILSYRTLSYYEILLDEINLILTCENDFDKALKEILLSINFNSPQFLQYLVNEIESILENEETDYTKRKKLIKFFKQYNLVYEKPDMVLIPKHTSIKSQITNWIIDEIGLLGNDRQISSPASTPANNSDFKLQTILSVSQYGYLLRIFQKVSVYTNKNQRELFRFFSLVTSTKQKDNISWDGLKDGYYKADKGTKRKVKDLIIDMLNEVIRDIDKNSPTNIP